MIAAVVVFGAGIALAVTQPGDLGGKETTQGASTTTKPSVTSTTASTGSSGSTGTTGTTAATPTTVKATGSSSSSSSSSSGVTTTTTAGATTTTTRPASSSTTTTTAPTGGLNQGGASGTGTGKHPVTGGTSMLALGFALFGAALLLRRTATARR